jgi:homoserine dehydrogenase
LGVIHIAGSGAGQEATASGLISDLINLMKTNGIFSFPDFPDSLNTIDIAELSFKYYFYIEAMDEPGVMASIASIFAENNISIETIIQKESTDGVSPVILITNRYFEKNVNKVIKTLDSLASIKTYRTIRIED